MFEAALSVPTQAERRADEQSLTALCACMMAHARFPAIVRRFHEAAIAARINGEGSFLAAGIAAGIAADIDGEEHAAAINGEERAAGIGAGVNG